MNDRRIILYAGEPSTVPMALRRLVQTGYPPWFGPQDFTLHYFQNDDVALSVTAVAAAIFDLRQIMPGDALDQAIATQLSSAQRLQVPIIVFVANGQAAFAESLRPAGVTDYLESSELGLRALARSLAAVANTAAVQLAYGTAVQQKASLAEQSPALLLTQSHGTYFDLEPNTDPALNHQAESAKLMLEIANSILSRASTASIAADVVTAVRQWLGAERGSVVVLEHEDQNVGLVLADDGAVETAEKLRVGTRLNLSTIVPHLHTNELFYDGYLADQPTRGLWLEQGYRSLLIIPLLVGTELIGIFNFASTEPNAFEAATIETVKAVAGTFTVALQQARLYERTEQQAIGLRSRKQYLDQLNAINQVAAETKTFDAALQDIAGLLTKMFAAQLGCIMCWGKEYSTIQSTDVAATVATAVVGPNDVELGDRSERHQALIHLSERALAARQPLQFRQAGDEPLPAEFGALLWATTVWVFPLIFQGEPLGAAVLAFDESEKALAEDTFQHAKHATDQAALALRNLQLVETLRRQLREKEVLYHVAVAGNELQQEDELIERVTAIIGQALYPDNFGILLRPESEDRLVGHPSYQSTSPMELPVGQPLSSGIAYRVFQTGKPARIADVREDDDYLIIDPRTRSELCVPIVVGQQVLGVINTESVHLNAFSDADERLLMTLAGQLGTALQRNRLFQAEQRQRQEIENLMRATAVLVSTLDIDEVLDHILTQLAQVVAYDSATLMLWQENGLKVTAARGLPAPRQTVDRILPDSDELFQCIRAMGRTLYLPDAQADPRFHAFENTTYVRGWMGIPLIFRNNLIGLLTVDSRHVDAYRTADIALAEAFANQVTVALENARMYEAEQRAHANAVALRRSAVALTRNLDLNIILETLVDTLHQLVPYDSATVQMFEDGRSITKVVRGFDPLTEDKIRAMRFNIDESATWSKLSKTRRSLILPDTRQYPGWVRVPEIPEIRSWLGVPLVAGSEVVGALALDKAETDFFTAEHQQLAETLAGQAAVAIQNALLYEQVQNQAENLKQAVDARTVELLNANERLKELGLLKSKFVSDVSHELRTPLTNIKLYLDLLERDKPERRKRYFAVLSEEVDRLHELVEDILDLSRVEADVDTIWGREPVNLNSLVTGVVSGFDVSLAKAALDLHVELDQDLPLVQGSFDQLEQVVTNLMANAVKYTLQGRVAVRTYAGDDRSNVCLDISDTGIGISEADIPHLFDRFFRGQNAAESVALGTGLGLSIVDEIVDLHQGWIEVDSILGEGSTFRIWLPALNPEPL